MPPFHIASQSRVAIVNGAATIEEGRRAPGRIVQTLRRRERLQSEHGNGIWVAVMV